MSTSDQPQPDAVMGPDELLKDDPIDTLTEDELVERWRQAFKNAERVTLVPPGNVYTALAAVQAELPDIAKDREAEVKGKTDDGRAYSYKYKYVDLATVSAAVLPMLGRQGLAWVTIPTHTDKGLALKWELVHGASGTRIEGILPISGKDPQALAGQITYFRRYALCAVVGVAAEEDDDAQRATAAIHSEREQAARDFDSLPKEPPAARAAGQQVRPPAQQAQTGSAAPSVATDKQVGALALRIATVSAVQLLNAWRAVEAVNAAGRKIDAETADKIALPYAEMSEADREGLPQRGTELRGVMAWRLAEEVTPDTTTPDQVALVREVARAAYGSMGDPDLLPGIKLSDYLGGRADQINGKPLPDTDHARTIAQEAAASYGHTEPGPDYREDAHAETTLQPGDTA